jgi:hypothetical protein
MEKKIEKRNVIHKEGKKSLQVSLWEKRKQTVEKSGGHWGTT